MRTEQPAAKPALAERRPEPAEAVWPAERALGHLLYGSVAGALAFAAGLVWHLFHGPGGVPPVAAFVAWGVLGLGAAATAILFGRWSSATPSGARSRRAAEAARRLGDYQRVFRHAGDAMLVLDPATGLILDANRRACELYEVSFEHIVGRPLANVTPGAMAMQARFRKLLADLSPQELETVHIQADGSSLHLQIVASAIDFQGRPAVLTVQRDLSERKHLEDQLRHRVFHDSLTGVANRALLLERAEHAFARRGRNSGVIGMLVLDLDNFKSINDTLGHQAGDQLLTAIGRRLGGLLRAADTVARLGGDEFAVLIEDGEERDHCKRVAERILEEFSRPFPIEGRELLVGTSIGVATSETAGSVDEMLRFADMAMYAAKSCGKGRYEIFQSRMHDSVAERLDLGTELRLAIERQEFELHYQPIMDLRSGRIAGLEALLRWNHPERGQMEPGTFVPLAEETGAIVPLGTWVLEQACRQLAQWTAEFPEHAALSLTVNIASRQFHHTDVANIVATSLNRAGLRPSSLILEATESVLMQDFSQTLLVLQQLEELGVGVAVDDFGTGFSNLGHLSRLPVRILKIDRSFVEAVGRGPDGAALARAIITLGETLGIETVAEGVQTAEQLDGLRALGCDYAQGFLFSAPLEAAAVRRLLEQPNSRGADDAAANLSNLHGFTLR